MEAEKFLKMGIENLSNSITAYKQDVNERRARMMLSRINSKKNGYPVNCMLSHDFQFEMEKSVKNWARIEDLLDQLED